MSISRYKALLSLALLSLPSASSAGRILADRVPVIPPAMPAPPTAALPTGSIWMDAQLAGMGHRLALAEDRRARGVGDILTIELVERLQAEKSTEQDSARSSNRGLTLPDTAPFSWIPQGLFSGGSQSSFTGSGSTRQANRLSGEITVTVTRLLPNGAMMVAGDRRMTLTRGEEQMQLTGIVRPEDIGPDNRILSTRVADARLRYSGTGEVAAQARQGWLSRFFDRIIPF